MRARVLSWGPRLRESEIRIDAVLEVLADDPNGAIADSLAFARGLGTNEVVTITHGVPEQPPLKVLPHFAGAVLVVRQRASDPMEIRELIKPRGPFDAVITGPATVAALPEAAERLWDQLAESVPADAIPLLEVLRDTQRELVARGRARVAGATIGHSYDGHVSVDTGTGLERFRREIPRGECITIGVGDIGDPHAP